MSSDWKYWEVVMELSWNHGGQCCDGTITMRLHAKSHGHAIARASDDLKAAAPSIDIEDATAKEVEL